MTGVASSGAEQKHNLQEIKFRKQENAQEVHRDVLHDPETSGFMSYSKLS